MILTVCAAQGAAGKKDGAASAGAGDTGFFPEVQGSPAEADLIRCSAESRSAGGAVCPALPRTERTGGIVVNSHGVSVLYAVK